jgi:hypothetical protein
MSKMWAVALAKRVEKKLRISSRAEKRITDHV